MIYIFITVVVIGCILAMYEIWRDEGSDKEIPEPWKSKIE